MPPTSWPVIPSPADHATDRHSHQTAGDGTGGPPVLIWQSGIDGDCTFFNEDWLRFTGRSFEAELGNGWASGVHPDDREACLRAYAEAFAARRDFQLEYRLRRYDGTYRWIRDIGTPRWSPDGAFLGYIGCALDVTQGRQSPLIVMHGARIGTDQAGASPTGNLRLEGDTFIGRASALDGLVQLHASTRLLTLVGPPGVGKTRLAMQLALLVQAHYPDGVWLVDLVFQTEPALVSQAVADVLQIRESPDHDRLTTLTLHLRSKRLLLILDNCEHLPSAYAKLSAALLSACPDLHILATSRDGLGIDGEVAWRVEPLALPDVSSSEPEQVRASEAVRLLMDRMSRIKPAFAITSANANALARICGHLRGIPLAIELMAPCAVNLGVDAAVRMLDFSRDDAGSGRALRVALDWSHRLLTTDERILFRRLAIFSGGWSLEAAQAVCSDKTLSEASVADCLERLVAKSLVKADAGEQVRHRFLEAVRTYALEQLELAGELRALKQRHAEHMLSMAERVPAHAQDPAHAALLEREQDNQRAALTWLLASGDAELGLRLASATFLLWQRSGHYAEGRAWYESFLARADERASNVRAWALVWLGELLLRQAEHDLAETCLQNAFEQHRSCNDELGVAMTLAILGNAAFNRGHLARAMGWYAEAIPRLQELGRSGAVLPLFNASIVALELGDIDRALDLAAECQARANTSQQRFAMATAVANGMMIQARTRRTLPAPQLLVDTLEALRPRTNPSIAIQLLIELGHVMLENNNPNEAHNAIQEAVELAYATGDCLPLGRALDGFGRCLFQRHPERAVRIAAAVDRLRESVKAVPLPADQQRLTAWLVPTRRRMGKVAYQRAWQSGRLLGIDEAVALARNVQTRDSENQCFAVLTPRERQVAALLGRGLTSKQIAAQLVISPATVDVHMEHILGKLGLHSRAQAAVWAVQSGNLND